MMFNNEVAKENKVLIKFFENRKGTILFPFLPFGFLSVHAASVVRLHHTLNAI